jgi:tetratricopeptide (TPR) repeat protein
MAGAADHPLVGPVPDWVLPTTEQTSAAQGNDGAIKVLLSDQQVRFSPTVVETYVESRVRIQTPQGLGAVGTITLSWQPDADTLTVHRLIVRRGAQVRDLLGKDETFTILRREDLLEQATLTGTLTAVTQPPDLQVGDIIEFAYTHRRTDPVVPDIPDRDFGWPNSPLERVSFRATWPKDMPLRWQVRDFQPDLRESQDGTQRSIAFTLEKPQALLQPTGAPMRYIALRRMELTTIKSWQQVSQRLAPLYATASQLTTNSPLRTEIEHIREVHAEPKERAAAALRLAQEQVRYVFLAMNQGGLVPASADQTWERRYGDCKAKTALLLALLHGLGIEAEAVAVNSALGDSVDRHLPAIGAFDHVLVRTRIGGQTYWLDGTRLGDRKLDRIQTPMFGWGLPLLTAGSDLVKIESPPLADPSVVRDVEIDASAGADEAARVHASLLMRSDTAYSVKLAQDNLDTAQREQGMRDFWRKQMDSSQIEKVTTRFDEETGELLWTADGTLRLDWAKGRLHEIEDMRLGYEADFSRPQGTDDTAPYAVAYPRYEQVHTRILLPASLFPFEISGENVSQTIGATEYRRTARIDGRVFQAESSFRSLAAEFPASEARAAESALRELYANGLYIRRPKRIPTVDELKSEAGKPLKTADEYLERGHQMVFLSMHELAIAEFGRAIELDPRSALAYGSRGRSQLALSRYEDARKDLHRALDLSRETANQSDDAVALRGLGVLELQAGRAAEAVDLLTQSLRLEEDLSARQTRADAYLRMRDMERGLADLELVSRESPIDPYPYLKRAETLVQMGRRTEALAIAEKALAARAGPAEGLVTATQIRVMASSPEEARAVLDDSIAKAPSADLYALRATIASNGEARASDLEQTLHLNPRHVPALQMLAQLRYSEDKDQSKTLDALDRLEAVVAPTSNSQMMRGGALARQGKEPEAKVVYAAARGLAKVATEFNSLCWSQATRNIFLDDALKDCDTALAMEPQSAAYMDSRGFVLLQLGRYDESIASYDAALAKRPQMAESLYGRGIAKLRLGRNAEAETDLAAAQRVSPNIEQRFANYGVKR